MGRTRSGTTQRGKAVISHADGKRFLTPEQRVQEGYPAEGGRGARFVPGEGARG